MRGFLLDEQTRGAERCSSPPREREPLPENPLPGQGTRYAIQGFGARERRVALSSTTALTPTATAPRPRGTRHPAVCAARGTFVGTACRAPTRRSGLPVRRLRRAGRARWGGRGRRA